MSPIVNKPPFHPTTAARFAVGFFPLLLAGCCLAPNTIRTEVDHMSHIGQHFGGDRTNFGAEYAEVIARWKFKGAYVDVGQGYNLSPGMGVVKGDPCPGAICGPRELTTVAVGYEWRVK
jgi:hypothetical protein